MTQLILIFDCVNLLFYIHSKLYSPLLFVNFFAIFFTNLVRYCANKKCFKKIYLDIEFQGCSERA